MTDEYKPRFFTQEERDFMGHALRLRAAYLRKQADRVRAGGSYAGHTPTPGRAIEYADKMAHESRIVLQLAPLFEAPFDVRIWPV